jgi:hypothetical protein
MVTGAVQSIIDCVQSDETALSCACEGARWDVARWLVDEQGVGTLPARPAGVV